MISRVALPLALLAAPVPGTWLHPSRMAMNTAIWAVGLVLQCALAFAVFRKGIARSFLGFAILAVFYPVRSALLFALTGRIDNDDLGTLSNVLSWAEAPLEVFVAVELLIRRMRETGGWMAKRTLYLLLVICAPLVLTFITMATIPPRAEVEGLTVFMSFLMLTVFAIVVKGSRSMNAVCIISGFACLALAELVTILARVHYMTLRDTPAFIGWGYVPAVTYLVIVIFWIVALKPEAKPARSASRRRARAQVAH
jgi:hypothetical protein